MTTSPTPHLTVRCHRRLRGPYTGGGALLRSVVPELAERDPKAVAARAHAVVAIAPDLAHLAGTAPRTLTNSAERGERTRLYSVSRTRRLAHSLAELLLDWARVCHPGGAVVALRELDDADPTDHELVDVLRRRCDPAVLTVVTDVTDVTDVAVVMDDVTDVTDVTEVTDVADGTDGTDGPHPAEPGAASATAAGPDPARLFVDSDGTSRDAAARTAYDALSADERARLHEERAARLAAADGPAVRLGALPYHLERGIDPAGAGADALAEAAETAFLRGFYEAALDYCLRGRAALGTARPKHYWTFTILAGTCLSYLRQGEDSEGCFAELRAGTTDPVIHMNTCYNMAMLYTRHLPKEQHDETRAVEWINTAIALADRDPDPHKRAFFGAFMRNARALIELHRADVPRALALVDEAMQRVETGLEDHEQLLHRSVLLYNRAQILANLGQHEDSLRDYDELIGRDPDYGDYYFERAAEHRALGRPENALADYAEAIRLSLPFHQAHFNRADLLRELGDHEGALRDLDYAVLLDPTHLDSLTNRADLLLDLGLFDRAAEDIAAGLALEPADARLLAARGALLAEAGDSDAALASFTAALDADPTLTAAWANRAVLHYTAGRPADSAGDLDRAIALDPDPALHANRALALQELGDHGRALADLDIAIAALGDEDPDLFYRRGASRRALGDLDGADADWRTHLAAYGPGEVSPFAAEIDLERTA